MEGVLVHSCDIRGHRCDDSLPLCSFLPELYPVAACGRLTSSPPFLKVSIFFQTYTPPPSDSPTPSAQVRNALQLPFALYLRNNLWCPQMCYLMLQVLFLLP